MNTYRLVAVYDKGTYRKEIMMTNLSTIVKISKILSKNERTYNDVEDILTSLLEHYRTKRKHAENDNA